MKKYLTALMVLLLSFVGVGKVLACDSNDVKKCVYLQKWSKKHYKGARSKDACMVQAFIEKGVLTVSANWNAGTSTIDIHSDSKDESCSMTCSLTNGIPVVLPLPSEDGTYTLTISTADYVFTGIFEIAPAD